MTKQKNVKIEAASPADKDFDLAIAAVDARLTGFVRDGMCFNKV